MQQVGCSVVPGWPAQHICISGVYSPIYSSSRWQGESFSTCVSDHSQMNQYSSDDEGELYIRQSSSITRPSPLDRLMSYPGHSLRRVGSYLSAEMQLIYPVI